MSKLCCAVLSRFSHVWLFMALWTVAHQVPLSMGFSRQEYWSGLPCLPPGDLPDPRTKPTSLMSPALAGGFFTSNTTWEAPLSKLKRQRLTIGNFFQLEKTIHEIHLRTANLKIWKNKWILGNNRKAKHQFYSRRTSLWRL